MFTTTYKNFKISAEFDGKKVASWDANNDRHNKVTVKNLDNGKRTSFDFWGSVVNPRVESEYDLLNAFYCFVSDALAGVDSFENFCSDFGYDIDSRNAEKIWRACKRSTNKIFNLTGYSVDMLYDLVNDLQEVAG